MISVNQQIQNNNLRPGEKIRDEEMMNIRKKPVCDTKTSYVCLTSCMFFCAFISIPLAMKKHSAAAFAWSSSPVSTVQMWKWGPFWSKGAVNLHKSSTPFPRKKTLAKLMWLPWLCLKILSNSTAASHGFLFGFCSSSFSQFYHHKIS